MAPSRSLWRAFCGLLIVHKNSGFSPPQPRCKHGGAPRRGAALKSSQSTEVLEALATLQPERDLGAVQAANKAKGACSRRPGLVRLGPGEVARRQRRAGSGGGPQFGAVSV
ncbi:hypothetical protein M885DRAFT_35734 [Pelagophyceae sp. CCMP2097]|nr:hypothetical protein M885DRAFT_35734 [Pelagophyceae sp. CCMP2097]